VLRQLFALAVPVTLALALSGCAGKSEEQKVTDATKAAYAGSRTKNAQRCVQ
jgi:hypothetical protein